MEGDKYFSSLLYSICEGRNSLLSSKTQEKIGLIILLVEDILLVGNDNKKLV